MPSGTTSLPIPSPGITAILCMCRFYPRGFCIAIRGSILLTFLQALKRGLSDITQRFIAANSPPLFDPRSCPMMYGRSMQLFVYAVDTVDCILICSFSRRRMQRRSNPAVKRLHRAFVFVRTHECFIKTIEMIQLAFTFPYLLYYNSHGHKM